MRSLMDILDLSTEEIDGLIELAAQLKAKKKAVRL